MMEALKALENAEVSLKTLVNESDYSIPFSNKEIDRQIRSLTLAIKKELKVDYSKTLKFRAKEKERLTKIYIEYLTGKADNFNTQYIQLVAWHLLDLKIMQNKTGVKLSIFEYNPNPFALFTVIEKTFRLFQKKRINVDKVSYALILNYLNNYKIASNRYKNELRKYLKSIRFSEDIDVYFNINNVITYTTNKTSKLVPVTEPYPERLLRLKIRPRTLDTIYFADSWFAWMFNYADLSDEYVLKNLNCSYYKICNEDYQKIILAKIIYDNGMSLITRKDISQICIQYLFPAIKKGNPFKKTFWDLNYTDMYKTYLDSAWNFIEQTFVKNEKFMHMVNFEV